MTYHQFSVITLSVVNFLLIKLFETVCNYTYLQLGVFFFLLCFPFLLSCYAPAAEHCLF